MNIDSLKKLYIHELKDLWSAENQVSKALPRCIEAVRDDGLRKALEGHHQETQNQIGRLKGLFQQLTFEPGGHRCEGMAGLLEELDEAFDGDVDRDVRDAMLIAALQRVEHYEIAAYGVARTFAEKMGDYKAADILQTSLDEEGAADRTLTRIAERNINFEALAAN